VDRAKLGDANQCFTYTLSSWLPFQGTSCGGFWDPYSFRSSYVAEFSMGSSYVAKSGVRGLNRANTPAERQAYTECRKIAPIMLNGDYYPLTPYSLSNTVWMAWQFDWPAQGDGVVQAFRRSNCDKPTKIFRLSGLNPAAYYEVTNFDVKGLTKVSGKELMEKGLTIQINDKPGAAVIVYREIESSKIKSMR
jgi:alpha-galactosidase